MNTCEYNIERLLKFDSHSQHFVYSFKIFNRIYYWSISHTEKSAQSSNEQPGELLQDARTSVSSGRLGT